MRYLYVRRDISFDNDGVPFRLFGTVLDITERKQIENELEMSVERFQHYAESSSDWFWETDSDQRFIEVTGSSIFPGDWISRNIIGQKRISAAKPELLETDEWKQHQADLEAHKPFKNFEYLMETPDNAYWISVNGSPRFTQDGIFIGYRGTGFNITDRKTVEEKLKRMAHYDVLTDLPNRVLLVDRLGRAMAQCQRRNQSLAVAYLDLDEFKAVNDTYGHNVGDKLLVELSKRMKEALRESDTLARIGGDEFIVVMVDLDDIEDKKPVLERLLKAAAEPITVDDSILQVSVSIGVTLYPQDAASADQLILHADQAMYIAKQAGKNRYHLFDATQEL
jgi:diguanylate cyclase (GGDEF)-like protein/PAS domain S-box-containing protein